MKDLIIKATKSTPYIEFSAKEHKMRIKGESYPENTYEFYEPIFRWLNEYFLKIESSINFFEFEIIYFNSSSSKVFMDIFDLLERFGENGRKIVVNWQYESENESSFEYGEEFAEEVNILDFNLVEI